MNDGSGTSILWIRRALRLDDNPAIVAALSSRHLIPVFVWSPEEEGAFQPGRCARWWVKQSLLRLDEALNALGSRLVVRRAHSALEALTQLVAETGAQAVYFNHLYDPMSLVRDHNVKQALGARGVAVRSFNADLLYEPWQVLDEGGRPFTSFDAFWQRALAMPSPPPFPVPPPARLPPVPPALVSECIDSLPFFASAEQEASVQQLGTKWAPGPEGALEALDAFLSTRLGARDARGAPAPAAGGSRLSPWIHWGSLSVRFVFYRVRSQQQQWAAAGDARAAACPAFLRQLGQRDYSRYLSFHFPSVMERALAPELRALPWVRHEGRFKAWKLGLTGYPLVDAAMRQLWSQGWLCHRLRVAVATFLVQHLLLPWTWGAKHFWDSLLDADLEALALGWQSAAGGLPGGTPLGAGVDVVGEGVALDPQGEYLRAWLPALARMPAAHIHAPWAAPPEVLAAADVELGVTYPAPLVTLEESASQMQQALAAVRAAAQTAACAGGLAGASGEGWEAPPDLWGPVEAPQPQPQPQPAAAAAGRDNGAHRRVSCGGGEQQERPTGEQRVAAHRGASKAGGAHSEPRERERERDRERERKRRRRREAGGGGGSSERRRGRRRRRSGSDDEGGESIGERVVSNMPGLSDTCVTGCSGAVVRGAAAYARFAAAAKRPALRCGSGGCGGSGLDEPDEDDDEDDGGGSMGDEEEEDDDDAPISGGVFSGGGCSGGGGGGGSANLTVGDSGESRQTLERLQRQQRLQQQQQRHQQQQQQRREEEELLKQQREEEEQRQQQRVAEGEGEALPSAFDQAELAWGVDAAMALDALPASPTPPWEAPLWATPPW